MNNKFDLADIQAFAAVAELQSFRAAADAIHLSQPAFSRRIDKLEEALGVRLLDRTTRRVTLTAVGRDFARKTRVWLDDLDGMLMGLGDVAARRMGEVTIACVPSAVYYFLPQVVKRYHERFPKIRVKVHDASANEVLVEAGPRLAGAFARAHLVDEYQLFVAPKFLGSSARPLLDWPLARMAEAQELEIRDIRAVGNDWRITAVPKR